MSSWHSYPKIYNVGHKCVLDIFQSECTIEEKIDGSQFSFGKFGDEIKIRSKGVEMDWLEPEKMFSVAKAAVVGVADKLRDGYTYRAEYLRIPKHNTLAYERVPTNNLIIFDISPGEEQYLHHSDKKVEAERLGFECVPLLHNGTITNADEIKTFMERVSILGGQKIEGIVIKNYAMFGPDKKVLMAKHVSEDFKEIHNTDWKERNPGRADIIDVIITALRTPARWAKAVQHLKERGELEGTPRDIGKLIKEAQSDLKEECHEMIKQQLYDWAAGKIASGATRGLPEWYKEELLKQQFKN